MNTRTGGDSRRKFKMFPSQKKKEQGQTDHFQMHIKTKNFSFQSGDWLLNLGSVINAIKLRPKGAITVLFACYNNNTPRPAQSTPLSPQKPQTKTEDNTDAPLIRRCQHGGWKKLRVAPKTFQILNFLIGLFALCAGAEWPRNACVCPSVLVWACKTTAAGINIQQAGSFSWEVTAFYIGKAGIQEGVTLL